MLKLEALNEYISHINFGTRRKGRGFQCSEALVICGSNAISKNNEQKGAKVALMTLNLIGIPCQVWPWEDISHSTSDCVCGRGEVPMCLCLQLCDCKCAHLRVCFMKRLNSGASEQFQIPSVSVTLGQRSIPVFAWRSWCVAWKKPATRPVGCRDLWPSDMCATLSVQ